MELQQKIAILSDAAKYDVSCSSSGGNRKGKKGALGSTAVSGICHSFTPDGRCVSLLKVLMTNYCIYDCSYCINRRSNQVARAAFTVEELVDLTMGFYKRNYIEGLFLSSGIIKNPDYTMELLLGVVQSLREVHGFRGYIHMKAIPGANQDLVQLAGSYVDRMSVNIELPSSNALKLLAPDKHSTNILAPMKWIKNSRLEKPKTFVPAGQSTQMIIGASPESDLKILTLSENLYQKYEMKRVYYSAYIPVNQEKNLPAIIQPPTLREHRLYQSDWLLRFYGFKAAEIVDEANPDLDMRFDPKTSWALRNLHLFPIEVNRAPYELLLRVPGVGIRGAQKIVAARRLSILTFEDLKKLRIVLKRAQYFVLCNGRYNGQVAYDESCIRLAMLRDTGTWLEGVTGEQLSLFATSNQEVFAEAQGISPSYKGMLTNVDALATNQQNTFAYEVPQVPLLQVADSHSVLTGEL